MGRENKNTFVRALIVGLVLALCALSFFNFFWRDPPFEISAGLLALISLIVLLSLSEMFDHLTFGTILSLKRKVEEEKVSKEILREDNQALRSQLVTLVANIQQSQVNNTFNAPAEAWAKLLGVVPSQEPAAKEKAEEEEQVLPTDTTQPEQSETVRLSTRQRYERQRAAESVAIRKYLDSMQIPQSERLLNVEFSSSFQNLDPVMDRRIVFDAYVKVDARERFIEATRSRTTFMLADRLYVMLTKIWLYRQAKKVQAELILLLVDAEDDDSGEKRSSNRLLEYFQPAIANDILRVESIVITTVEIDQEISGIQQPLI